MPDDDLIEQIYEAAAIGEKWPRVLDDVAQRGNGAIGCLMCWRDGAFVG